MPWKDTECFSSLHYFGMFSPSIFPEMCSLPKDVVNDVHMWYLQLVY